MRQNKKNKRVPISEVNKYNSVNPPVSAAANPFVICQKKDQMITPHISREK